MKEPMSGQSTAGTPLCPRCKATQMVEVTSIAPLLHEPGLIAYECPSCGHRPLIPHMADERALTIPRAQRRPRALADALPEAAFLRRRGTFLALASWSDSPLDTVEQGATWMKLAPGRRRLARKTVLNRKPN